MQALRRPLLVPVFYWRTILLLLCAGLLIAEVFRDQLAVMLSALACVFFFRRYECRRWVSVSTHFQMGDILFRLTLAMAVTFALAQQMR